MIDKIVPDKLYSSNFVLGIIPVVKKTLYEMIKKGDIKAIRIGHKYYYYGSEILRVTSKDAQQSLSQKSTNK